MARNLYCSELVTEKSRRRLFFMVMEPPFNQEKEIDLFSGILNLCKMFATKKPYKSSGGLQNKATRRTFFIELFQYVEKGLATE